MKLLLGFICFFGAATAFAVEQLAPNDPLLAQDPTQRHTLISDYAIQSGSDKVAAQLATGTIGLERLLNKTVENITKQAIQELTDRGYDMEAQKVFSDYNRVKNSMGFQDVGDHAPWAAFLTNLYNLLQATLGDKLMKQLHLDDIWEINYTVPVAMHPTNHEWDMVEYRKHFTVLAGVISYWVSFIACEIISYGAAISLVCEPIGSMIELVMKDYIAPPISDKVYKRANGLPL